MNSKDFIKKNIQDDNIDLIHKGFVRKHHGRSLYIYFISGNNIVFIEGELSGVPEYDFLIYAEYQSIDYYYDPLTDTFSKISLDDRKLIQKKLIEWLTQENIRNDIILGR